MVLPVSANLQRAAAAIIANDSSVSSSLQKLSDRRLKLPDYIQSARRTQQETCSTTLERLKTVSLAYGRSLLEQKRRTLWDEAMSTLRAPQAALDALRDEEAKRRASADRQLLFHTPRGAAAALRPPPTAYDEFVKRLQGVQHAAARQVVQELQQAANAQVYAPVVGPTAAVPAAAAPAAAATDGDAAVAVRPSAVMRRSALLAAED